MRRRDFLAMAAAGLALAPARGRALVAPDSTSALRLLRISHSGAWQTHPDALNILALEAADRTSMHLDDRERRVALTDPALFGSMFAVLSGTGAFTFSEAERAALGRWLGLGGFLVVDNSGLSAPDADFEASARRELSRLFPQTPLERVSPDHVLFRTFYRLDYPPGRTLRRPWVEGVRLGPRYCAVLLHNDLLGAYASADGGRTFLHVPTPGGEQQREMALRFGINLLMYATCQHYKDDQVHVDYLLHKRNWRVRRPE
jgi:hypothetical protein